MFYGVEMDIIQMSIVIVLVADDVVPESPLPDRYIAPEVFGPFITVGEAEFDGLHEIGNGWIGFDRPPWCIVGQVAKLPDGSNRICRALGSGSFRCSQPDLQLRMKFHQPISIMSGWDVPGAISPVPVLKAPSIPYRASVRVPLPP